VWKRWKKHSVNELQEHIERQELKGTSTAPKVPMQGTERFPKDVLEKSNNRLFGLEAQICYPAWIGSCRDKGVQQLPQEGSECKSPYSQLGPLSDTLIPSWPIPFLANTISICLSLSSSSSCSRLACLSDPSLSLWALPLSAPAATLAPHSCCSP
jgi:hypothetical protein